MARKLIEVLQELGLSQYLDAFIEQGFDTWETILDITESDLDSLGVKLGHRRKLQRRIAKFRGVAPDVALISPTRPTADDGSRSESSSAKQEAASYNLDSRGAVPGVLAKRKYRRHPKPDECAPDRPPSAYVLFSNKMREDLKGRNLSFTEIAKLVGENWQSLTPAEREPFETQAQVAKDKYNHDLAEYKKTPEYKKYMLYLQDFKAKHSNQAQDKDAFKRIKLADFGGTSLQSTPGTSAGSSQTPSDHNRARSATESGSGSGNESNDHETPHPSPTRERRVGSTVSNSDSHYSSDSSTPGPTNSSFDGVLHSPTLNHSSDSLAERSPPHMSVSPRDGVPDCATRHSSNWVSDSSHRPVAGAGDSSNGGAGGSSTASGNSGNGSGGVSLPSLSDMFDDRRMVTNGLSHTSQMDTGSGYANGGAGGHGGGRTSTSPGGAGNGAGDSRYPGTGGAGQASYGNNYSRTPMEGSLPIHALLSGKPVGPSPSQSPVSALHQRHTSQSSTPSSLHPTSASTISPDHKLSPPSRAFPPSFDHQPMYGKEHSASSILQQNGGAHCCLAEIIDN